MSKFHVIVTNKTKMRRNKPGEFRMEFKSRKAFENAKVAICLLLREELRTKTFITTLMWIIAAVHRRNC